MHQQTLVILMWMPAAKDFASRTEKLRSYRRSETRQRREAGPSRAVQYLHRNATVLSNLPLLQIRVKVKVWDRQDMQARNMALRECSPMNDTSSWASRPLTLIVHRCCTLTLLTIWLIMQAICNSQWASSKMNKKNSLISDRSERRHRNARARKIAAIQKITHESKPWTKQSTSWAINKTLCNPQSMDTHQRPL